MDRAFALFGEAATYVDRAANAVPCTVLVERDLTRYGDQAATIAQHTALVQVRVSEVPEPPRRSETFQLAGGKVLTVDALQSSTEFLHRVMAS
jgi:hypothetical protein